MKELGQEYAFEAEGLYSLTPDLGLKWKKCGF
jgi:hypothetical protein